MCSNFIIKNNGNQYFINQDGEIFLYVKPSVKPERLADLEYSTNQAENFGHLVKYLSEENDKPIDVWYDDYDKQHKSMWDKEDMAEAEHNAKEIERQERFYNEQMDMEALK